MILEKNATRTISFKNKSIPEYIKKEAKMALSFYPELMKTPIEFRLTNKLNSAVMKARPKLWSLLKKKTKREYVILISRNLGINDTELHTTYIPEDVMIGWLGHELSHIVDYSRRSTINLIAYGLRYLFSESFTKMAEQRASRLVLEHNMKRYSLATKNYILNHLELSLYSKEKIKLLYASPDCILDFVNEQKSIKDNNIVVI